MLPPSRRLPDPRASLGGPPVPVLPIYISLLPSVRPLIHCTPLWHMITSWGQKTCAVCVLYANHIAISTWWILMGECLQDLECHHLNIWLLFLPRCYYFTRKLFSLITIRFTNQFALGIERPCCFYLIFFKLCVFTASILLTLVFSILFFYPKWNFLEG